MVRANQPWRCREGYDFVPPAPSQNLTWITGLFFHEHLFHTSDLGFVDFGLDRAMDIDEALESFLGLPVGHEIRSRQTRRARWATPRSVT